MPYAGVNGQRLYYEVGGDGETMVLLHGALSDADMMEAPATGLASGFRAVRYDRRGHGRTGDAPGPVSLADEAADLAAFLDWFGIAGTHILAHDEGAEVALELAIAAPDRVLSLGLLAPTLEGFAWSAETSQARAALAAAMAAGPEKAVRELLVPSPAFDAAREHEGLEERLLRMFLRSAPAAARFVRATGTGGAPQAARLSAVTARTAIFVGDRDETDRLRCAEAIADGIAGAELVTFPGLGRFLHVVESRAVMRRMTDFFIPEPQIER